MVQAWFKNDTAADVNGQMRFNGDAGTNYTNRHSIDGGVDTTRINRTHCDNDTGSQEQKFFNAFIVNVSANEKFVIGNTVGNNTTGAGNAPNRREWVTKWANTATQITQVTFDQLDVAEFAAGAELRVWGSN